MVTVIIALLFVGLALILYRYLVARHSKHSLWQSTLAIGTLAGVSRAILACAGWYYVERISGPLQIPAFALSMLAWPEGMVLETPRVALAPLSFYPKLACVLILSTVLAVSGVALIVHMTRGRGAA